MVRPANFARASETVADNAFQAVVSDESFDTIAARAIAEFDHFVDLLKEVSLEVTVIEDTPLPVKPDAVFPNNWFSTHHDGTLILYPIYWPQRRAERRQDIIELLQRKRYIGEVLDLSWWEGQGDFLESTGSLVLDRVNRIAYACVSQRCTREAVHEWCRLTGYKPITFAATGESGLPIYHTNVLMAIGTDAALIGLDAVDSEADRAILVDSLALTGKQIVILSHEQLDQFAGNALELASPEGPLWVMSDAAFHSLTEEQRDVLMQIDGTRILHPNLETIERYGGGSARCMLAELF